MKLILVIYALCLVRVKAGIAPKTLINNNNRTNEVLKFIAMASNEIDNFKNQIAYTFSRSNENATNELKSLRMLREQDSSCAAMKNENITLAVYILDKDMEACNATAAKIYNETVTEILPSIEQLIVGGKDLPHSYQHCQTIPILSTSRYCLKDLHHITNIYLSSARYVTIKIKKRTDDAMVDIGYCTNKAIDKFVRESNRIHGDIWNCMDKCVIY